MRGLKQPERIAVEAVARHFSATLEKGDNPPAAYLTVAGKRVALDIATLKPGSAPKPHLRFDKTALRVIDRLKAALAESVPDGMTVLLTITAPIRLPSKTAASLEDTIKTLLGRNWPGLDVKDTMHGNRVQIRGLRDAPEGAPKLIGLVHNPDTDPLLLFNTIRGLLEVAGSRAPKAAGERWLALISPMGVSWLEAYRSIYSQLSIATAFQRIVMVFADGSIAEIFPETGPTT